MNGPLMRLKGIALRPIWSEDEIHRARRRCRALITTPFAALGGLTWGVYGAPMIGVGSPLMWGALGAFAFPFFMYLEQKLVPGIREMAHRAGLGRGALAGAAWETGVVAGLIYLVTRVLGAPVVPAVGTALGIGAFYAFAMEYVLCGSAAADVAALLRGGGGSASRPHRLSGAEALSKRGDHEGAIAIYREALATAPREGATYVRLARAQLEKGDHAAAADTLRDGVRKATLSSDQDAYLVRQIHEVCVTKLKQPQEAIDDLRRLLERQPEGVHAVWAARALSEIEAGAHGLDR